MARISKNNKGIMAIETSNGKTKFERMVAEADLNSKCGMDCPLFKDCRPLWGQETFGRKIFDLCSSKFREGYRKGYNRCKREKYNDQKGK